MYFSYSLVSTLVSRMASGPVTIKWINSSMSAWSKAMGTPKVETSLTSLVYMTQDSNNDSVETVGEIIYFYELSPFFHLLTYVLLYCHISSSWFTSNTPMRSSSPCGLEIINSLVPYISCNVVSASRWWQNWLQLVQTPVVPYLLNIWWGICDTGFQVPCVASFSTWVSTLLNILSSTLASLASILCGSVHRSFVLQDTTPGGGG